MNYIKEFSFVQMDGSIKVYNEQPWWMGLPMQKHEYRVTPPSKRKTKAEKISDTMTKIGRMNRDTHITALLSQGIVRRKRETGRVTIRDVMDKQDK